MVFGGIGNAYQAGNGIVAVRPISRFMKDLPEIVEDHAPAVMARLGAIEERIEPESARPKPPHASAIESRQAPGSLNARKGMQALREPQTAVRSMRDRVDELMGITNTKTRENDSA